MITITVAWRCNECHVGLALKGLDFDSNELFTRTPDTELIDSVVSINLIILSITRPDRLYLLFCVLLTHST